MTGKAIQSTNIRRQPMMILYSPHCWSNGERRTRRALRHCCWPRATAAPITPNIRREKTDPDFPWQTWWYDPFEIVSVLYLRKLEGLDNPTLEHPLLATSIGMLPAIAPTYSDELLEAVIAQACKERPELAEGMATAQST